MFHMNDVLDNRRSSEGEAVPGRGSHDDELLLRILESEPTGYWSLHLKYRLKNQEALLVSSADQPSETNNSDNWEHP